MNKKSLLKIILFILFLIPINSYALEGDYVITSKLSNDMVLDIAGGNAVDNANIQLFTRHGGQNQQWKFVYNEAGYYKILSTKDNNYCLDINNEPYTIKSNVKLSVCSDAETQHFIVEKDNAGYYKISSYDKQYVIDVGGGVAKDRANIQLFTSHDNDNQRFAINKEIEGNKTIEDGIYTISTNNLYMNANSNSIENRVKINFTTLNNSKNQKWKVTYLNNGTYQISSVMDKNYSLDIPGGKKVANTYIQLFQNNYGINQQWIIKDNGNGTYQIISKSNGLNLEASSEISFVNDENNSENQNFKFEVTTTKEEIIIPDGIYTIIAKAKEDMVLDIAGGTAKEDANVQLYTSHDSNNQRWNFVHNDKGYYSIKSENNNNYCLSISTNKFTARNNIGIKKCNNSLEQRWRLKRDSEGYFKIVSDNDEFVLDIAGAKTDNKTNIQLFNDINSLAQRFILNKYVEGTKTIENGVYEITSSNGTNINVAGNANNKTNINVAEKNNSENQKFIITYLENGYYKIESLLDRNYLMDIAGARKTGNTNVQLFSSNGGDNQHWIIKDNGNGTYKIISKLSYMNLDVVNNNILVNEESTSNTQNFTITKTSIGSQVIDDGYYFIDSKLNTKKLIDVAGGTAAENKNVQIFSTNSGLNQKWHFVYIGDGYYKILSNINENYALTMSSDKNIQINTYKDSENQKWIIRRNEDNSYSLINSQFIAVSLYNSKTADKTNLIGIDFNKFDNQKFRLIKTIDGVTTNKLDNGYYSINSIYNDNYVLDVAGGKNQNNANIQIYESNSKKHQKWYFEYHNNYYLIKSGLDDTKALTLDTSNSNVKLYTLNSSYEQQWVLKEVDNGVYRFASNANGQYLSIAEERADNKINILVKPLSESQSQQFRIHKTRLENIVIDISAHNGVVDWDKIKNDGQVYGVILRVAAGSYYIDSKLETNVNALNRLNIPYGVYLYSYAEDQIGTVPGLGTDYEAKLEALRLVTAIKNYNINPTLGIYYDLEVWENKRNINWTSSDYEKLINKFHEVMTAYGYGDWKIYANLSMANSNLYPWRDRITWIAQWNDRCTYTSFYNLWQYTSDGYVDGVPTKVDMNIYYFD